MINQKTDTLDDVDEGLTDVISTITTKKHQAAATRMSELEMEINELHAHIAQLRLLDHGGADVLVEDGSPEELFGATSASPAARVGLRLDCASSESDADGDRRIDEDEVEHFDLPQKAKVDVEDSSLQHVDAADICSTKWWQSIEARLAIASRIRMGGTNQGNDAPALRYMSSSSMSRHEMPAPKRDPFLDAAIALWSHTS